jgi:phage/conjugal plasmid C-4 type zinc finger TraR family protein
MDEVDIANEYLERSMRAWVETRPALSPRQDDGPDLCVDCGEPILEARKKAMPGCIRLVECQEMFENG